MQVTDIDKLHARTFRTLNVGMLYIATMRFIYRSPAIYIYNMGLRKPRPERVEFDQPCLSEEVIFKVFGGYYIMCKLLYIFINFHVSLCSVPKPPDIVA